MSVTHIEIQRELEHISNKCIKGDLTVVVFELLKTTKDLDGLCAYLHVPVTKIDGTPTMSAQSLFDSLLNAGVELE